MKKINDIGLRAAEFIEYGCDFSLELLSVYNQGEFMGKIICEDVKIFSIYNDDLEKGEGFESCYISSILIKNLDNILMEEPFKNNIYYNPEQVSGYEISLESGSINGTIICLDVVIDIVDKYKNILIEE